MKEKKKTYSEGMNPKSFWEKQQGRQSVNFVNFDSWIEEGTGEQEGRR